MADSDSNSDHDGKKYIETSDDLETCGWGENRGSANTCKIPKFIDVSNINISADTYVSLRTYQLAGVNWLIERYYLGHGCILGDEMGLGKTCQTIAMMAYIHSKEKSAQCSLVVCPRSVLENWQGEIKRFAPGLKVQCLIGDKEKRQEMSDKIKADRKKGSLHFDIMVTTYEICLKDESFLRRLSWHILVVDEAHRLKNQESLLYKTLSDWNIKQRVLLTGTPVQNNLNELYSLLSFTSHQKFPAHKQDRFVQRFSDMEKGGAAELHKLLQPYLLRRTKLVVLKDLPQKSEVILYHGISKLQVKLYKAILTKDIDVFESAMSSYGKQQTSLMNILMQLRKCVNHPYLFDGVEPEPFQLGEHLVEASGKLVLIDKLLKYLKSTGHKVLLFSQMTHMLDVLQDYLGYRGYSYERLDGSVRGEERFLAVQNFNQNDETFVFLLSTKAGGQGINLTSADTVIFVDSDFNPQNDLQAAARAHRIGQTRQVKVVRLIGQNTVEEIILNRAEDKLKLTEKVIEEGQFSLGLSKQSLFTGEGVKLQDILKFGVDELLNEDREGDEEIDFTKLLGPTVSGEWQTEEEKAHNSAEKEMEAEKQEGSVGEGTPQSMYVFEGTDYSKEPSAADRKVFDDLIAAEKSVMEAKIAEERPMRKRQTVALMGLLPEVTRKPRKKLSPEELEERRKKRQEAAERRAKEAEEQELRKAQEMKKRRDDLWKRNHYESCNIILDSEGEDEEGDEGLEMEGEEEDGGDTRRDIKYVIGDVTQPKDTDRVNNIVVHCADDSGRWGKGGIFSAISRRSSLPEEQYQLAGKMQDVALGDCHLIPIDDKVSREDGNDWLALIIAQHRDKRNNLSGIKLSALRYGLERVCHAAIERKASVHLPRIGHDTPGFNWYGTEKLIKKHLATKGIPTYIYYFPRKHHKRPAPASSDNPPTKMQKRPSEPKASTSNSSPEEKPTSTPPTLLNVFNGKVVHFHTDIPADDIKKYRRYVIAYDGTVEPEVTDTTTHIVVPEGCDREIITDLLAKYPEVTIATSDWLDDCLTRKKCLPADNYQLS